MPSPNALRHGAYAAFIRVMRILAVAFIYGPMLFAAGYWIWLLARGPAVGGAWVTVSQSYGVFLAFMAGIVCLMVDLFIIIPIVTDDRAREI